MTHPTRNTIAHRPASALARRGLWLALAGIAWLVASPLVAAGNDLELEAKIHRALSNNVELKKASLFVRVADGKATLGGTVPSPDLKREALRLAERVEGVVTVRGDGLYVVPSTRRPPLTIALPLEERPTQSRAASPALTRLDPTESVAVPSPRPTANECLAQSITLFAPEAAVAAVRPTQSTQLTAHPRPTPPVAALLAVVESLRRQNSRFQNIRILERDATIYIYPGNASADDAMTFAQAVRKVPGVREVVIAPRSR